MLFANMQIKQMETSSLHFTIYFPQHDSTVTNTSYHWLLQIKYLPEDPPAWNSDYLSENLLLLWLMNYIP